METYLINTKSQIPAEPRTVVVRARLLEALDVGIAAHKWTLVAAPAGYGKSTLLAQWANAHAERVAWLALDEAENDAETFMRYLVAAWSTVHPVDAESSLGMLLGAMAPEIPALCAALINAANEINTHTVFVLDDFHLIDDPAVHETVASLIEHAPPTLHFVTAGRGVPPLPVARARPRATFRVGGV